MSPLQYKHRPTPFWLDPSFNPFSKDEEERKLEENVEYKYDELPIQPVGRYEICMKRDCNGGRFIAGCLYHAYKCSSGIWMVETDEGTFFWIKDENFTREGVCEIVK